MVSLGFDWLSYYGVFDKVVEEVDEVKEVLVYDLYFEYSVEEIGDLLFVMVNVVCYIKCDLE